MARYASDTSVSVDRSRLEIERILERYGASSFMYARTEEASVVAFVVDVGDGQRRQVRFVMPMPDRDDPRIARTPTGKRRDASSMLREFERAQRQRWRALALVIKAKLEAVASGVSEFESEFLAHIVLPDGTTVAEFMRPQIATAYETGKMPRLGLPAPKED
jgi:hypothetical protein